MGSLKPTTHHLKSEHGGGNISSSFGFSGDRHNYNKPLGWQFTLHQPHRNSSQEVSGNSRAKLKNWQTIWPLAGRQIGILGGISLVSSVFSWFKETNEDHAFLLLVNLGVLAGLMVWTLGLILPINLQLNDGTNTLKKGESNVESLLAKWAPLHHVRTLGGLVCMACLTAYWMKKAVTA